MNEISLKFFVIAFQIAVCFSAHIPSYVNEEEVFREVVETTTIPMSPTTKTTWPTTTTRPNECPYFEDNLYGVMCFYWSSRCYCFAKSSFNDWDRAKEFCLTGNMTLLSIETEEEDYTIFINTKYNPGLYYTEYWTSGRYSQEGNNQWEWALTQSFVPMNYTHWYAEGPNSSKPGSCVSLHFAYNDFYQWGWGDNACCNYAGAICESSVPLLKV